MTPLKGKLMGIAYRVKSRGPMVELETALITPQAGVVGDSRGKPGQRQVTVLSAEAWQQACASLGRELPWTLRRANLLIDGIPLPRIVGATLHIGDVVLKITDETAPCARMDEAAAGLRRALTPDWRGGVCCQVVRGGQVSTSTEVAVQIPQDA